MHCAADENQRGAAVMGRTIVLVAVSPDDQLLQHEETEDAGQQRGEDEPSVQQIERLRQERQERDTEQRADREADERRDDLMPHGLPER